MNLFPDSRLLKMNIPLGSLSLLSELSELGFNHGKSYDVKFLVAEEDT